MRNGSERVNALNLVREEGKKEGMNKERKKRKEGGREGKGGKINPVLTRRRKEGNITQPTIK
jgi:hypothetical protein